MLLGGAGTVNCQTTKKNGVQDMHFYCRSIFFVDYAARGSALSAKAGLSDFSFCVNLQYLAGPSRL